MKQRIITGAVLAAIFIPLLIVSELFLIFQIMIMVLSIVASYELIRMYEKEKKYLPEPGCGRDRAGNACGRTHYESDGEPQDTS